MSVCAGRGTRGAISIRIDSTAASGGAASRLRLMSVRIARTSFDGAATATRRLKLR